MRLKYDDGSVYEGAVARGRVRHGFGVYTFPDGDRYSGEWKDGKKHGSGSAVVLGNTYDGTW
eukprot:gene4598-4808_t